MRPAQDRLACARCNGSYSSDPASDAWDLCPSADLGEPCLPQPSHLPSPTEGSLDPALHDLSTTEGRCAALDAATEALRQAESLRESAQQLLTAAIRATESTLKPTV